MRTLSTAVVFASLFTACANEQSFHNHEVMGVFTQSDEPEAIFDLSSGAYGDFTFGVNAVPTAGAQITVTYIVNASSSTENRL